jgi:hypothetical protein
MERFAGCTQADRDRIFGGTAAEVFKLG